MVLGRIIDFLERVIWNTFIQELLSVDISDRVHSLDNCIHQRLRKTWLVQFIVSHFTVANKIDNDVFVESLTILCSNFESIGDVVHRVSIYVEDWS